MLYKKQQAKQLKKNEYGKFLQNFDVVPYFCRFLQCRYADHSDTAQNDRRVTSRYRETDSNAHLTPHAQLPNRSRDNSMSLPIGLRSTARGRSHISSAEPCKCAPVSNLIFFYGSDIINIISNMQIHNYDCPYAQISLLQVTFTRLLLNFCEWVIIPVFKLRPLTPKLFDSCDSAGLSSLFTSDIAFVYDENS